MNTNNLILRTDSYKLNHWNQYPHDTEAVYSYFESREGATWPYTVLFGLQPILRTIAGCAVTLDDVEEAQTLATAHFGSAELFNYEGWRHIAIDHEGRLPVHIKAAPEGIPIPTGNVLMTVENTCEKCFWLTNALESLLTHVWYPSTVATLSRTTKEMIKVYLEATADSTVGLDFMLHDFGYRGATTDDAAAIGGAGHLVNFLGTDTLPAMLLAVDAYGADLATLAFSVPATEHSVMTAKAREGEFEVVDQLLDEYPNGILSVVADSYNIYDFVERIGTKPYRDRIVARDGKFVVRPDSTTDKHPYPSELVVWIMETLWEDFGGSINSKGFKVLDPHIGVLWGDGIDPHGIENILSAVQLAGFSVEPLVFGMGGGLLQKVNRDTQRFAFKSSAQKRNGEWFDVYKEPLDATKKSKRGRLKLWKEMVPTDKGGGTTYVTVPFNTPPHDHLVTYGNDELVTVFNNGEVFGELTFDEVRKNAALR